MLGRTSHEIPYPLRDVCPYAGTARMMLAAHELKTHNWKNNVNSIVSMLSTHPYSQFLDVIQGK